MIEFSEMAGQDEETRVSSVSRIIDKAISGESCLVTIYGRDLGKQYPLSKEEIVIGRGADNDIVLDMDNVSRRHAKVINRKEGFFLEDLGSTNGSYVNDEEVRNRMLKNGDLIKIGGAILKFLQGGNIEALFHEEIYRMTIVDGLTQVHNKRYFLEFMDREMARCARYNRPLSLILFDIDHFKKINDTFGHLAGDSVLRQLGALVRNRVRRDDVPCRTGGEEFSVILPEISREGGMNLAEKLRASIEAAVFKFEGTEIPVTVSLGVAEWDSALTDPQDLVKRADEFLYEAKRTGRNRVCG